MTETPYKTMLSALGLPDGQVQKELDSLIEKTGKSPNDLCLDDLRLIVCEYLQDTFAELKDELGA